MTLRRLLATTFLSASVLTFQACSTPGVDENSTNNVAKVSASTSDLNCAASPTLASVTPGENDPIMVVGSGGSAPYFISGFSTSFTGTTTVNRSYLNSATTSVSESDSITITDSSGTGASATCPFSVTVSGTSTASNPLICSVSSSLGSQFNEGLDDTFTFKATGGSGYYTFSDFGAGSNGSIVTALSSVSSGSNSATAVAVYANESSSYSSSATATLTDSAGNTAACSSIVTINSVVVTPMTCTVSIPNGSTGQTSVATASVSNAQGSASLVSLSISDSNYSLGSYSGLSVPIVPNDAGTFTVYATVQDTAGGSATCTQGQFYVAQTPPPPPAFVPVYRFYNGTSKDHFLTLSYAEGAGAKGYSYEGIAFNVATTTGVLNGVSFVWPLYRCWLSKPGNHFTTTNSACEGAANATNEGLLGYISPSPGTGVSELWRIERTFPSGRQDRLSTASQVEEQNACTEDGFHLEGIQGYVQ